MTTFTHDAADDAYAIDHSQRNNHNGQLLIRLVYDPVLLRALSSGADGTGVDDRLKRCKP